MEAKLSVNPSFTLEIDRTAISKIETALAFFRNSHPANKDPDLDQLLSLFKTTITKVREYDAALRGVSITSSAAGLKPEVDEVAEPKKVAAPPEPKKKAAPAPGAAPPGFGASAPPGAPPGGFPPAVKKAPAPPENIVEELKKAVTPPESGAQTPPSEAPNLTVDDAIQGVAPVESKAPRLGSPPGAPGGPPGAPPGAAAPSTPGTMPGTPPPVIPPAGVPGLPAGGPPGAPAAPKTPPPGSPPPPAASDGAPPPPDEEF